MRISRDYFQTLIQDNVSQLLKEEDENHLYIYNNILANKMSRTLLLVSETITSVLKSLNKTVETIIEDNIKTPGPGHRWTALERLIKQFEFAYTFKLTACQYYLTSNESEKGLFTENDLKLIEERYPKLHNLRLELIGELQSLYQDFLYIKTNKFQIENLKPFFNERLNSNIERTQKIRSLYSIKSKKTITSTRPQGSGVNNFNDVKYTSSDYKNYINQKNYSSILKSIDSLGIKYCILVQSIFQAILSIDLDIRRQSQSFGNYLLGDKYPNRSISSLPKRYQQPKFNNKRFYDKQIGDIFDLTSTEIGNKNKPISFNHEVFNTIFANLLTNPSDEILKVSKLKHPIETSKALIIVKLLTQLESVDKELEILFENEANKILWKDVKNNAKDVIDGHYVFPEVEPMFKVLFNLKLQFKNKFNKFWTDLRSFEDEYVDRETLTVKTRPFKSINDFFDDKRKMLTDFTIFVEFSKIQFKNYINKMLMGVNANPEDINSLSTELSKFNSMKIQERLRYWDLFTQLGWIPADQATEEPPTWLYSGIVDPSIKRKEPEEEIEKLVVEPSPKSPKKTKKKAKTKPVSAKSGSDFGMDLIKAATGDLGGATKK